MDLNVWYPDGPLFYQDDWVTIYCGDCLEIMPLMEPESVDLVVTDPPYGVDIHYGNQFDDTRLNSQRLIDGFLPEAIRLSRKAVLFPSGEFPTEVYTYQKYPPKWRVCWYKGAQSTLSAIGFCDWEMIFVYGKKIHNHVHDYFYAKPESMGAFGHPCPKPVEWSYWLIKKFDGYLILDPFLGSGTTCVAAKMLDRKSIGIDISPKFCEISVERVRKVYKKIGEKGFLKGKQVEKKGLYF